MPLHEYKMSICLELLRSLLCQMGMLSKQGRCLTFDASADGFAKVSSKMYYRYPNPQEKVSHGNFLGGNKICQKVEILGGRETIPTHLRQGRGLRRHLPSPRRRGAGKVSLTLKISRESALALTPGFSLQCDAHCSVACFLISSNCVFAWALLYDGRFPLESSGIRNFDLTLLWLRCCSRWCTCAATASNQDGRSASLTALRVQI